MSQPFSEKKAGNISAGHPSADGTPGVELDPRSLIDQPGEVFGRGDGDVNFRTVGWIHAAMIFLKVIFATGVLSISSVMFDFGAVPGSIVLVAFTVLNGYSAIIQGNFRKQHPSCHSIADMAGVVGGVALQELTSVLFIGSYVITAASGIAGVSAVINALSTHAACTIWCWLTWVGFFSVFAGVLVVVIRVTLQDRPAVAPPTGDFDLGFKVVGKPSFAAGVSAAITMFVSSAATSAFLPVMAEMKQPKDYDKAVYHCMGFVTASYLAFTLVMYYWCGQWIASPSLGSAEKLFRSLGSWLACTSSCSILAFILASAIPIFNYILAVAGSLCFAPLTISLPGLLWIYDNRQAWKGGLQGKAMPAVFTAPSRRPSCLFYLDI
ncbi:hypothetical protein BDV12DRAFT_189415 [Aspergillus spectabilis]